MSKSKIERSVGMSPGMPWMGPLPGGGYQGKTNKLDKAVMHFAKWLQENIGAPVEVRFNSDRMSGGAFAYPHGEKGYGNPEVGIGARLTDREKVDESTPLRFNVLIYPEFLINPDDLGEHTSSPDSTFGYWSVDSAVKAYNLVKRLVKPEVFGIASDKPKCQRCGLTRLARVNGKCSDACFCEYDGIEYTGYAPSEVGVGGGDYVELTYCLTCGQIQGKFPISKTAVRRALSKMEEIK